MRNVWKGILHFVLAVVLAGSFVGCGKEENSPAYTVGGNHEAESAGSSVAGTSGEGSGSFAGKAEDNANGEDSAARSGSQNTKVETVTVEGLKNDKIVYIAERMSITPAEDVSYYYMKLNGEELCYGSQHAVVGHSLSDGSISIKTMEWSEAPGDWGLQQAAFDADGNTYAYVSVYTKPNQTPYLCKFDAEGKSVYAVELSEYAEQANVRWSSSWKLETDKEGHVYLAGDDFVWFFEADGSFGGEVTFGDYPSVNILDMVKGADDKIYVGYQNAGKATLFVAELDAVTVAAVAPQKVISLSGLVGGGAAGLLAHSRNTVYQYDRNNLSMKAIFGWTECDINGDLIQSVDVLEDGRIVVVTFSSGEGADIRLIEGMDEAVALERGLLTEKEEITIALNGYVTQNLKSAVVEFNKESDKYKVVLEDYTVGAADSTAVINRLSSEIVAGKGPDLIDDRFGLFSTLAEKGGVEDLTPYFADSQELSVSDFLEPLVKEYTRSGRLVAIPYDFKLNTVVADNELLESYGAVGTQMGWTLEEMFALLEENPQVVYTCETALTKKYVLMDILRFNGNRFLDWEAGTCDFSGSEFQQILDFVKQFPDKYEAYTESTPSVFTKIQEGEQLLVEVELNTMLDLQLYGAVYEDDFTCIGYPVAEGVGCYAEANDALAISSASDNKEGAWAFLEFFLQYEREKNTVFVYGFPSCKTRLEKLVKLCMNSSDNLGVTRAHDGWRYAYHTSTQEEIDQMYALFDAMQFRSVDWSVVTIISEEAGSYFSGQKPIDVVAGIIENRVQIFMEENSQ